MKYSYSIIFSIVAFAAVLCSPTAGFASILGSADKFAVLAGSTVTNTGSSTVTGDLGVSPGSAIVGFDVPGGPGTVNGTIHGADGVSLLAQKDATTAWTGLKNMAFTSDLTGQDLGNRTLLSGVYHFDTSAELTGALSLDAQGMNNAYWVFQIGTELTTATDSSVNLINPGSNNGFDDGVFWQIGSSATLGTRTAFEGNILADQSITLVSGASIANGRALAKVGAVTMDANTVSNVCPFPNNGPGFSGGLFFDNAGGIVPIGLSQGNVVVTPEPASMVLLGIGGAAMAAFGRRKKA